MDNLSQQGNIMDDLFKRKLGGGSDSDTETNETAEITFSIIFYGLFAAMLVIFWFVFKRG